MTNPNAYSQQSGAEQLPPATAVDIREWAKADQENPVIETKGLGPCIGIAAYDPATKTGHMAHIATPMFEQPAIADMLQSVKDTSHDSSNVRIWVRGGQPHPDDATSLMPMGLLNRETVMRNLAEAGFTEDQIDYQFDDAPMGSRSTHMRLDTLSGEFEARTPDLLTLQAIGDTAIEGV
jgi:chemotaxis receptor (MCP) glutamine deamidase CheD